MVLRGNERFPNYTWTNTIKLCFLLICFHYQSVVAQINCLTEITVVADYSDFVQDITCDEQTGNYFIDVYEDCPSNVLMFNVAGDNIVIQNCNNRLIVNGMQFGFANPGDSEVPSKATYICAPLFNSGSTTVFSSMTFYDVNEFPPQPAGELDLVQSIYPDENTLGVIYEFSYQDLDIDEAQYMTFTESFDADAAAMFEIVEVATEGNIKNYSLNAKNNLDFETKSYYSLPVTFSSVDSRGTASSTDQIFIIFVQDIGDNPPVFTVVVPYASFDESQDIVSNVFEVAATDRDVMVDNDIQYFIVSGNDEDFFAITNSSLGMVSTTKAIDREALVSVVFFIEIEAREFLKDGTVAPEPFKFSQTTTVRVDDVNDVDPSFSADYSQINYDENTVVGVTVLTIKATDPDENDRLTYSISDNEYLQIEDDQVGDVSVKNMTDRELLESFEVTVTVTDLADHQTAIDIKVTINDLNDNSPVLLCDATASIYEDEPSGTFLANVTATDEDSGIHQLITYLLKNLNYNNNENQYAPFEIDPDTGEITSMNETDFFLDRESKSQWELYVGAHDNCDAADSKCTVNFADCILIVDVLDVNDNPPDDFRLNGLATGSIITNEILMEGDDVMNMEISATDPDEPGSSSSEIVFEAVALYDSADELVEQLFLAVNDNQNNFYFCTLQTLTNLTGLRGQYSITIQGSDNGDPQQVAMHNYTLVIEDANDMKPEFLFQYGCLEASEQTIHLTENSVDLNVPLNCEPDAVPGNEALIYVLDNDAENTPNSIVNLIVDYENSIPVDGGSQLTAFYVIEDSTTKGKFGIAINTVIDRESGSIYNLTLLATDQGNPQQSSSSWVYVIVNDINEFEPTFCQVEPCQQTLYITENTNNLTDFIAATDQDNPSSTIVTDGNTIYYYLLEDVMAFDIPNSTVPQINPIISLDRESVGEYQFDVLTSNSKSKPTNFQTNQILQISVTIMDVNDNAPHYDTIIYGDFLNTGNIGDIVAELEFIDEDLNETLTYTIGNDTQWSDNQVINDPFRIETIDERRSKLVLSMEPVGKTGYCTFTVHCQDAGGTHEGSAQAQVFVVTSAYIVPFYFLNDLQTVTDNSKNIQDIFTTVFNYPCVIDDISVATDANNNVIEGQTVVSAHFIQEVITKSGVKESDSSSRVTSSRRSSSVIGNHDQSRSQIPSSEEGKLIRKTPPLAFIPTEEETIESVSKVKRLEREAVASERDKDFDEDEVREKRSNEVTDKGANEVREKTAAVGVVGEVAEGGTLKKREKIVAKNEHDNSESSRRESLNSIFSLFTSDNWLNAKLNKNQKKVGGRSKDGRATVTYQLVPKEEIEQMGTQGSVTTQLDSQLAVLDLNLVRIGEVDTTPKDNLQQKILSLKIGVGVVTLVLGLLVILLLIIYIGKTRKMKRQIKVLSTNTFGSKSSDLNRIEADMSKIPGSNIYAKDGTNPLWNNSDVMLKDVTTDDISDGSEDSIVLAGVEEEPAFRNYDLRSHASPTNNYATQQPSGHYQCENPPEYSRDPEFSSGVFGSYDDSHPTALRSTGNVNPLMVQTAGSFNVDFSDNSSTHSDKSTSNISEANSSPQDSQINYNFSFQ